MLIYFLQDFYDEIADQIFKLREQRERKMYGQYCYQRRTDCPHQRAAGLLIKQPPARLEAFGEALVKRWLERIIVWDDHFTVELKSGLNMDIEG